MSGDSTQPPETMHTVEITLPDDDGVTKILTYRAKLNAAFNTKAPPSDLNTLITKLDTAITDGNAWIFSIKAFGTASQSMHSYTEFYPNGKKRLELEYQDGKKKKLCAYDRNNDWLAKLEGTYGENEQRTGTWVYYESGRPVKFEHYKAGEKIAEAATHDELIILLEERALSTLAQKLPEGVRVSTQAPDPMMDF